MDGVASSLIGIIVIVIVCISIRLICTVACRSMKEPTRQRGVQRRVVRTIRIDPPTNTVETDRQGNIFTISDDTSNGPNRYSDFFYLEPSSDDAARIRAQQEKDDKDLPSYEEVMASLTPTNLTLAVPPYTEIDMNTATANPTAVATTTTTVATDIHTLGATPPPATLAPSTSRAAAIILPAVHASGSNSIV